MIRPYSMDLRNRVVAVVEEEGLSRHQAAARFGIAVSTAVHWVRRYRRTGSVAPGNVGGHKLRVLRDEHAAWLIARCQPDKPARARADPYFASRARSRPRGSLPSGPRRRGRSRLGHRLPPDLNCARPWRRRPGVKVPRPRATRWAVAAPLRGLRAGQQQVP